MSRLAKKPITLQGTTVRVEGSCVVIKGPKGEQTVVVPAGVAVEATASGVVIKGLDERNQTRANVGTAWSLIRNAVRGVSEEFIKKLEIQGVGYRALMEGATLVLALGYVNPVRYEPRPGITIQVQKNAIIVSGISKQLVGQTAAEIRGFKKPEPYKGKGIRYEGEVIKLKPGKKAATGAAT